MGRKMALTLNTKFSNLHMKVYYEVVDEGVLIAFFIKKKDAEEYIEQKDKENGKV